MNKTAIRKFAVWARRELIQRISQKALQFGISEEGKIDPNVDSVNGIPLTRTEKSQRKELLEKIAQEGYQTVMEEVAYTWFNRFAALRYMEVNRYLPSHIRVFTNDAGEFHPQILTEALQLKLKGLDEEKVFQLKNDSRDEELFQYLLVVQCNALNEILPDMFQKIADYTELLMPDHLLRQGSVLEQMVVLIPEEDWRDQVQIIGWLYQYYNTEPKDQVFTELKKKKKKITRDKIPAATQLFTPEWIVRYMVENSLGRLWLEGHPDTKAEFLLTPEEQRNLRENRQENGKWKYFLEEEPQVSETELQLKKIRQIYGMLGPEDITCLDPCMGSGHILCYFFDCLIKIYESYGYTDREAAGKIVEKNLYGLDIDERAAQMAYFAVMMKGRQYDRNFFSRHLRPHVYAIEESNGMEKWEGEIPQTQALDLSETYLEATDYLIDTFQDAKEYGSLIEVEPRDYEGLAAEIARLQQEGTDDLLLAGWLQTDGDRLVRLARQAQVMSSTFWISVTNPPYVASNNMSSLLTSFAKKHYPVSKTDLFAMFIERCISFTRKNGFQAMITQHSWMFLSSFEELRTKLRQKTLVNMVHLGPHAFEEIKGEVVQVTSFVLANSQVQDYLGKYYRLLKPTTQDGKEQMFFEGNNRYTAKQEDFVKIPGAPVAYWATAIEVNDFVGSICLSQDCETRKGLATSNNNRFLRLWHEISLSKFSVNCLSNQMSSEIKKKWFPENKGGSYRKWYGNNEYVINWENNGYEIRNYRDKDGNLLSRPQNLEYNFKQAITWSKITTSNFSARICFGNSLFDDAAAICYHSNLEHLYFIIGFLNSCVSQQFLSILNPTINVQIGDIGNLPIKNDKKINKSTIDIVKQNIALSKTDWDSFETSWEFQRHPLTEKSMSDLTSSMLGERKSTTLEDRYLDFKAACEDRFLVLQDNEQKLNRIFINLYGLQNELTPEVADKDITIHRVFDQKKDVPESMSGSNYVLTKEEVVKSLLSYTVGCIFGRYSLDVPGLVYAGGQWDEKKYSTFIPDKDNIIPICDDEYFTDDIVDQIVQFVETVYGRKNLEVNLQWIAASLKGKGSPRDVLRSYFLKDFFKDHCRTYQKRPIYWLFDSGKKNGFKCLVYMHRYRPDTIARIRTDYIHQQQARYRTALEALSKQVETAETGEKVRISRQIAKLQNQTEEIRTYEEKIHHLADQMVSINLDDGVKHNYALFQDVLAKIR